MWVRRRTLAAIRFERSARVNLRLPVMDRLQRRGSSTEELLA
jgi:hypothetical protein